MKLVVVSGSHRPQSESERIGRYLANRAQALLNSSVYELHLGINPLPLWDEHFPDDQKTWGIWQEIKPHLDQAEGFILVTPEWGGMATPAIKNFFLLASSGELAHKPALLVSVSATRGGAFPIAELRQSSVKNTQICYLPEHLIIRNASQHFLQTPEEVAATGLALSEEQAYIAQRADCAVKILGGYADSLQGFRQTHSQLFKQFSFGMS